MEHPHPASPDIVESNMEIEPSKSLPRPKELLKPTTESSPPKKPLLNLLRENKHKNFLYEEIEEPVKVNEFKVPLPKSKQTPRAPEFVVTPFHGVDNSNVRSSKRPTEKKGKKLEKVDNIVVSSCPICAEPFPTHMQSEDITKHIDDCLSHSDDIVD